MKRAAILMSCAAVLMQACTSSGPGDHPNPSGPTSPGQSLSPAELAQHLARQALDLRTGPDAVRRILTLSGIPIISAADGSLLNQPSVPTFVNAYVYDIQVPLIADAIRSNRTWYLEDVADLPDFLFPALGRNRIDLPAKLGDILSLWVQNALTDSLAPAAFPALVVRELSRIHDPPQEVVANVDPDQLRIDPLQFLLIGASMMSPVGSVANATAAPTPGPTTTSPGPAAREGCAKLAVAASRGGGAGGARELLLSSMLEKDGDKVRLAIDKNRLRTAQADLLADLVLLAGIHLEVEDDILGRTVIAPLKPTDPRDLLQFKASLRFDSAMPGQTIACGGLAGARLPENGPITDWLVKWVVAQKNLILTPDSPFDAGKLARDVHGTSRKGYGEITGPEGVSTLKLRVKLNPGCPNGPSCGKGPEVLDTVEVISLIDIRHTAGPFSLGDLFAYFGTTSPKVRPLALEWRDRAFTEIGLPVTIDTFAVDHIQPD